MPKSAFIAIVGRPSTGKSTLLNALCGAKVSIVSPVPQTTRNAIRGIVTRPQGQLIFVDTPGYHISERKFNLKLRDVVVQSIADVELILYVIDASRAPGSEEYAIAQIVAPLQQKAVIAINKIDHPDAQIDKAEAFIEAHFPGARPIKFQHSMAPTQCAAHELFLGHQKGHYGIQRTSIPTKNRPFALQRSFEKRQCSIRARKYPMPLRYNIAIHKGARMARFLLVTISLLNVTLKKQS